MSIRAYENRKALAITGHRRRLLLLRATGLGKAQVLLGGVLTLKVERPEFQNSGGLFDSRVRSELGHDTLFDRREVLGQLDDTEGTGFDPFLDYHVRTGRVQRRRHGLPDRLGNGNDAYQESDAQGDPHHSQQAAGAPSPEALPRVL
ncbi:MAG: hypothetical protein BWY79_01839 [Actinobacteria bacterium ADurb.Bin444]|nr:MAG: hypothetical protein BWY79_01839 [Actinobacteria bacterium ADurb.Bin444]